MKHYFAATAIAVAVAGCASNPSSESPAQNASASPAVHSAPTQASRAASSAPAASSNASGSNVAAVTAPSERSVYFDYDSNVLRNEYVPVVQSNARYLSRQRSAPVRVEGNTDERGSREYNLALGQRRADAVKERLTLLGVPAQQIETVSFGEEKPRAEGENEQAYSKNRRADIVYAK
jgi:peptidoglycan-associated lipoprotein